MVFLFSFQSVFLCMKNVFFLADLQGIIRVAGSILHGEQISMQALCQTGVRCYWSGIHYLCLLLMRQPVQFFWECLDYIHPQLRVVWSLTDMETQFTHMLCFPSLQFSSSPRSLYRELCCGIHTRAESPQCTLSCRISSLSIHGQGSRQRSIRSLQPGPLHISQLLLPSCVLS